MKCKREFHPVGQGAFYSERHFLGNGKEFTIVYDCGSDTFNGESIDKLEDIVKNVFPHGHTIDVLFISHFHNDHTNGIIFLKDHYRIKNVVIPLLSRDMKAIIKINNYIRYGEENTDLLDNPISFFNSDYNGENTKIIMVKRTSLQEDYVSPDEIGRNVDSLDDEIRSGTKITGNVIDWFFIPYNYDYDKRSGEFITELKKEGILLEKLKNIEDIKENYPKIKQAYNNMKYDIHLMSMILYSGNINNNNLYCCRFHHFEHYVVNPSCIYLGDITLRNYIVEDICNKLKFFLSSINIIQVPHHGSEYNHNRKLLDNLENLKCAVISYGINNTHKHPSEKVIDDLIHFSICPHRVTERAHSKIEQYIY